MMSLDTFADTFGIDPAAARRVLEEHRARAGHDQPWYVQTILALGSWVTAAVVVALGGFFIQLAFELEGDTFGVGLAVLGLIFFAPGFVMLLRRTGGVFAAHFAIAIAAAGQAMVAIGAGIFTEEVWPAALASLPFAVAVAWFLPSRALQAISTAWAAVLVFAALHELGVPFITEVAALGVAAGVALHLHPPRRDLTPSASVLMLTGPVLSIMFDLSGALGYADKVTYDGWLARAMLAALVGFLLLAVWRHLADRTARTELALFAAAALAVCLLLPVGGAAALVIMVLAFVLGSRVLAIIATLLEIYFLWKFYYDLHMTLLQKSALLAVVGVVVLGLWLAATRLATDRVRS